MKKMLCILTSSVLFVGSIIMIAGCGSKNSEDNREVRELDSSAVKVWQGAYGDVWMELKDYEHEGYQSVSDSGQSATSIDFSLDGGKTWARKDIAETIFPQKERGVYPVISPQEGTFTFYTTGTTDDSMPATLSYQAGDDISVTFRIPESDMYKASEWSAATTYTLKAPVKDSYDIFANHFGSFLSDKSDYENLYSNDFESNGFVAYKEENLIKFGKIESSASERENGKFDYTFTPTEELTATDKDEIAQYEYKFVSKQEYRQNITEESVFLLDSVTPAIGVFEDEGLMSLPWTGVSAEGITFNQNDSSILWQFDVEIPNGTTQEIETYTQTSFILLVRLKATDDTVHSKAQVFEYILSSEPSE